MHLEKLQDMQHAAGMMKIIMQQLMLTYIGRHARTVVQTKLMHDPIRFVAMGCASFVKHQCLTHTNELLLADQQLTSANGLVPSCCLPKASSRGSVSSVSSRVLLVFPTEEVVIRLLLAACVQINSALFCTHIPTRKIQERKTTNFILCDSRHHAPYDQELDQKCNITIEKFLI
jgi:hypothetical protein